MESKFCPKCKTEKILSNEHFYKNKSNPDGFDVYCKWCRNAANARSKKKKVNVDNVVNNTAENIEEDDKRLRKKELLTGIKLSSGEIDLIESILQKATAVLKVYKSLIEVDL